MWINLQNKTNTNISDLRFKKWPIWQQFQTLFLRLHKISSMLQKKVKVTSLTTRFNFMLMIDQENTQNNKFNGIIKKKRVKVTSFTTRFKLYLKDWQRKQRT